MKHIKTSTILLFMALAATFLAGCASWQADRQDPGYSNYNTHGKWTSHYSAFPLSVSFTILTSLAETILPA